MDLKGVGSYSAAPNSWLSLIESEGPPYPNLVDANVKQGFKSLFNEATKIKYSTFLGLAFLRTRFGKACMSTFSHFAQISFPLLTDRETLN